MTTSIYQNPFVFEKHGPFFSQYIGLCIHNFKNKKGQNTECHHIFPRCLSPKDELTGKRLIDNNRYNLVHLEYKDHQLAHELLAKAIDYPGLKYAFAKMNRVCMRGENNPDGW